MTKTGQPYSQLYNIHLHPEALILSPMNICEQHTHTLLHSRKSAFCPATANPPPKVLQSRLNPPLQQISPKNPTKNGKENMRGLGLPFFLPLLRQIALNVIHQDNLTEAAQLGVEIVILEEIGEAGEGNAVTMIHPQIEAVFDVDRKIKPSSVPSKPYLSLIAPPSDQN